LCFCVNANKNGFVSKKKRERERERGKLIDFVDAGRKRNEGHSGCIEEELCVLLYCMCVGKNKPPRVSVLTFEHKVQAFVPQDMEDH
jgi:hypothetical protein